MLVSRRRPKPSTRSWRRRRNNSSRTTRSKVTATYSTSLRSKGGGTIDLVVDNAGFELCTDLLLADHLVGSGAAKCVRFRVKHHPTFVSDALERDVDAHIEELLRGDGAAASVARRWKERRAKGEFTCVADTYWAMPYALWDVPEALYDHLRDSSSLIVVKGDANYLSSRGPAVAPRRALCGRVQLRAGTLTVFAHFEGGAGLRHG